MTNILFIVTVVLSAPSRPAHRTPAQSRVKALALLKRARAEMRQGHYEAALSHLERGFTFHRIYVFPLLMGVCSQRLDRPKDVRKYFQRALKLGGKAMTRRHRRIATKGLQWATMRLRYDKVLVQTVPKQGVSLTLDGTKVGTTPLRAPLVVNIGSHELIATDPQGRRKAIHIEAKGGRVLSLTVDLTATAKEGQNNASRQSTPTKAPPRAFTAKPAAPRTSVPHGATVQVQAHVKKGWSWIEWTCLGVAIAGAGLLVPGISLLAIHGTDAGESHNGPYLRVRYDTKNAGLGLTVTGGLLLAGASITWGVVAYLKHRTRHEKPRSSLQWTLAPNGVQISMHW